jgi:hypothetical protein
LQALTQLGQIDGAMALVNLHRVAAAERDMGASRARQINEIPLAARAAAGAGFRGHFGAFVRP